MGKTCWKKELDEVLGEHGETWEEVEGHTFEPGQIEQTFDGGFGGSEGCHFTLWTEKRVYFPVVYDGAEWVASVPRHPNAEKTAHVGGE